MRCRFGAPVLFLCFVFFITGMAFAAPNAGFDVTGFIQDANLNAAPRGGNDPAMRGGTIVINSRRMTVPDNSIVQFPASAWTWAQLFDPTAWAPVYDAAIAVPPIVRPDPPAGTTGLALTDPLVNHFPSYEVRAVGNIITDPATGAQSYIVGLIVPVAQQGLNNHSGYISYIDYTNGRFRVGGIINDPNCSDALPGGGPTCSGTLCEINDPVGRYGLIHSPDQRFKADTDNPTISTATGYPVCIPRVAPPANFADPVNDPLCPHINRPLNDPASVDPNQPFDPFLAAGAPLKRFTMPQSAAAGTTTPDPWQQVPLKVGDWVDVSGTILKVNPALGNSSANHYLSVHTLTAHLGIKTTPGTQPAYLRVEGFLFGVGDGSGGPTVSAGTPLTPIVQETSTRIQLVVFTTDADPAIVNTCADPPDPGLPQVALFGIYVDPVTGVESEVPFPDGTTLANAAIGEMCMDDPIRGRIRWQTAKHPRNPVPGILGNAAGPGNFYREYVLKLTGPGRGQVQAANGLTAGQYRLPIFEYIFGEGTNFGEPAPPFNFNDFGFLVNGQGPSGPGGVTIGPLKPFPMFQ